MHSKTINAAGGEKTWAMIFETGDEIAAELQRFAEENHLAGSHFTAIGALSDVVLAWFEWQTREYRKIPVREQVEVLSLIGDIADDRGKPKVHAHLVIGKSDGTAHGGHLIEAHVRPTLELILTESPRHLQRRFDPASGLALIAV
jgi:predicted DNA-binding protein with PD1-like motif